MSAKWKFILIYGLGWGFGTFVLFVLDLIFIRHEPLTRIDLIDGLAIWPIFGIGWGSSMWAWRKRYLEKRRG